MIKVVEKTTLHGAVDEVEYWAKVPMAERIAAVEVILDGVKVPFIGREDLIVNKRATGRPQDIADVLRLTANES